MCRMKSTRRGPLPSGGSPRGYAMLIRIEPDSAPKLFVFLQNSGFQVSLTQEGEVQVPSGDEYLLAPVLAVWNELHKDARAEIVQSQANH
jgi:hypothetical protein